MPGLRAASLTAGIGSAARNWGSVAYRCATRLANRSGLSAWPDPAVLPSLETIFIVLPSIGVGYGAAAFPRRRCRSFGAVARQAVSVVSGQRFGHHRCGGTRRGGRGRLADRAAPERGQ